MDALVRSAFLDIIDSLNDVEFDVDLVVRSYAGLRKLDVIILNRIIATLRYSQEVLIKEVRKDDEKRH